VAVRIVSVRRVVLASAVTSLVWSSNLGAEGCRLTDAIALYETRQDADSRALFETCARESQPDPRAAQYLGRLALARHEEDEAVSWLEKAAVQDSRSSETQVWLGSAYGVKARSAGVFKMLSLGGKVKKAFERAVELDPASPDAHSALMDFYLLAPGIAGGSVTKAREQAAEIRKRDAMRGHRAFGRIAEHQKDFAAAAQEYERAAREFPQKSEPVTWRASLAAQQKDFAKAFDLLEALLKTHPSERATLFMIGRLSVLSEQRLERGEECLRLYLMEPTSAREQPSFASAHFRLGSIQEKKGARDLARAEYTEALRLDPYLKEAREALARVS
jgi:tetratricopeptide (TPR) repeat protein